MTMTHIETVTVGSGGAASITFSAIPDTFTDLYLVLSHRIAGSTDGLQLAMRFNASTSGYSRRLLYDDGSTVFSAAGSSETFLRFSFVQHGASTANTFGNASIYLPNYRSSVAKSMSSDSVTETNGTNIYGRAIYAGLWTGTDPITSITFFEQNSVNFAEFSSASLYGITAGSDGIVTVS